jgi:hypothetical protein
LGGSNYVASAGAMGDDPDTGTDAFGQFSASLIKYRGPFTRNSTNRITDCTDGTSNTIGFGETLGGSFPGQRDLRLSWFGAGCLGTKYGLSPSVSWAQFSSKHTAVVNFGFMDGSVRGLTTTAPYPGWRTAYNSPSWVAYQTASGMQDGDVVQFGLIGQ